MANKCKYIKQDGANCEGYALKNNDYCFTHDPDSAEKRALARREGGYKQVTLCNNNIKIKRGKIKHVMKFLATTITEVREGVISPQVANSIFVGCSMLLRCFELYDIENKIEKLEKHVEENKKR